MFRPRCLPRALCALVLTLAISLRAAPEWRDAQGTAFKADPVEILGPFAAFKSSATNGRLVLLRGLNDDDCRRFFDATRNRPRRAASFADAQGEVTRDLPGHVLRLVNGQLVPADLRGQPEPQLVVALYGTHNNGESWLMLNNFTALYRRITAVYPGVVEAVFLGYGHKESEHRNIAAGVWMPWLVADFSAQSSLRVLSRFTPSEAASAVVFSRDGAPLLAARIDDLAGCRKFADELTNLVGAINETNPRTWPDRAHYAAATRPLLHAHDDAAPELIGNPIRPEGLRPNGIERVAAHMTVDAQGAVTAVELSPDSVLPPTFRAPLVETLRRHAVFAPAIHNGTPVASTFDYVVTPAESAASAADVMWVSGNLRRDIAIDSWLVLSPVPVDKEDFSEVKSVDPLTGKVTLTSFEVTANGLSRKKQMNAFHTDWFTAAGAASVHPAESATQEIDGNAIKWRRVKSVDGYIDLQAPLNARDYCIGYAWTEIDVPADTEAYLGIGSDDGLKIWLNGALVHDKWVRRLSRLDDDVVPLKLKAGRNTLLMKIQNAIGDWSFVYRLRTR
ncbi:MAG: hypothetical protein HYV96_13930 [Opitutae bacterium]|nr:hypothetical protein [Opitutae bacterium]